jgi:hypothetical protein
MFYMAKLLSKRLVGSFMLGPPMLSKALKSENRSSVYQAKDHIN